MRNSIVMLNFPALHRKNSFLKNFKQNFKVIFLPYNLAYRRRSSLDAGAYVPIKTPSSHTSLPHKSLIIVPTLTYTCSETLMVKIQEIFSPFPLCFSGFPVTHSLIEQPDSIRLHVFENNCGMCPTVSPSFTTLKLDYHFRCG